MMRPPRGVCAFMILIASCVHRNMPVKLVATTFCQVSKGRSSSGMAGAPMPALLNRTSSRPKVDFTVANSARIELRFDTSVGTASACAPISVDLARNLVEHFLAPAGQHQAIAGFGQRNRHRAADAGSGSGHQRNFCGRSSSWLSFPDADI